MKYVKKQERESVSKYEMKLRDKYDGTNGYTKVVPLWQGLIVVVQGLKQEKPECWWERCRIGGCEGITVFNLFAVVLCQRSRYWIIVLKQ